MRSFKFYAVATVFLFVTACTGQAAPKVNANDDLEIAIKDIAAANKFNGVILVSTSDGPVIRKAFGHADIEPDRPLNTDTTFNIASISKSFSAALTMQLVERGMLSLDDTLKDHLPDLEVSDADKITIRQLLQNRSGLAHTTDIPGWFDPAWKAAQTPETFLKAALDVPLKSTPGTEYYYSNIGYYLLGLIIDRATGTTYEKSLETTMLTPLNMAHTGQVYAAKQPENHALNYLMIDDKLTHIQLSNTWMFRASASLYSNAEDLLKWSNALQNGKLLSDASMATMFDRDAPMGWIVGEAPLTKGGKPTPIRTYNGEMAGYTTILTYFPHTGMTVILLGNMSPGYNTVLSMTLQIAAAAQNSSKTGSP